MRRKQLVRIAAASALALGSLAGCSTYHAATSYLFSNSASTCPDAAILATTASLPAFDPAKGDDPSNVLYSVVLKDVKARCDYSKRDYTADVRLKLFYQADRPPGGIEARYRVPYFVAVVTGGQIVDKEIHWLELGFRDGAVSSASDAVVESTIVHVEKSKKPYEYHMVVGFQLTKAQIDYIKKMGRYAP